LRSGGSHHLVFWPGKQIEQNGIQGFENEEKADNVGNRSEQERIHLEAIFVFMVQEYLLTPSSAMGCSP
jgi:hypothetical protein